MCKTWLSRVILHNFTLSGNDHKLDFIQVNHSPSPVAGCSPTNVLYVESGLIEQHDKLRRYESPLSITKDLSAAVATFSHLRSEGIPLEQHLAQKDIFSAGTPPLQASILQFIEKKKRSARAIADTLKRYVSNVEDLGNPKQKGLFGDEAPPTVLEMWSLTLEKEREDAEKEKRAQPGLFERGRGEAGEGEVVGEPARKAEKKTKIKKAPEGAADVGGYAKFEGETPEGKKYQSGPTPFSLAMPQIVQLYNEIMEGKLPQVVRGLRGRSGVRGRFYPGEGGIKILAGIAEDMHEAVRVLGHEIGHWVSWLPEKHPLLKRGNILGHIKSLKSFGQYLIYPESSPGPLNEKDKRRIRKIARDFLLADNPEIIIDEVIKKEMPISPEDVLNIWNRVDFARTLTKELYDFVAKMSTAEKKSIVKEAMKGQTAEELKRFGKVEEVKTGKKIKIKKDVSEQEIQKKFEELIKDEIQRRHVYYLKDIMEELKRFTILWKPFDPAEVPKKYTRYRFKPGELYADALSALFTNPDMLRNEAPIFYEAFFEFIHSKPEFINMYNKIQDEIKQGTSRPKLVKVLRSGMRRGEEALMNLLGNRYENLKSRDA